MTKSSAIHKFWSSFGIPAYNETTVPDEAKLPYITYSLVTDSYGSNIALSGSVWFRSTSWVGINQKVEEIATALSGVMFIECDGGAVKLEAGTPFATRIGDDTDGMIRRALINVTAEFLTTI